MFRLGVPELLIIGVIVLFLFGGKRLPEMGKGIGEGIVKVLAFEGAIPVIIGRNEDDNS